MKFYLRPGALFNFPPNLGRLPTISVISGIQLAKTALSQWKINQEKNYKSARLTWTSFNYSPARTHSTTVTIFHQLGFSPLSPNFLFYFRFLSHEKWEKDGTDIVTRLEFGSKVKAILHLATSTTTTAPNPSIIHHHRQTMKERHKKQTWTFLLFLWNFRKPATPAGHVWLTMFGVWNSPNSKNFLLRIPARLLPFRGTKFLSSFLTKPTSKKKTRKVRPRIVLQKTSPYPTEKIESSCKRRSKSLTPTIDRKKCTHSRSIFCKNLNYICDTHFISKLPVDILTMRK